MSIQVEEKKEKQISTNVKSVDVNNVAYRTIKVQGLNIFYRESIARNKPSILLLHGFPSSSHMFRNLFVALGNKYHLVAPDYPGFGNSAMPKTNEFEYTFDHVADVIDDFTQKIGLKKFGLYMMDYGAPVGYRIATKHPDKITTLFIQNGNAYEEGLNPAFWGKMKAYWQEPKKAENIDFIKSVLTIEGTKSQYLDGVGDETKIDPDSWIVDQYGLDRPGNQEIQLAMFYSYRTNPPLYPKWQEYMRKYQPPVLVTWGKNDFVFPEAGAHPFKRDVKDAEIHLLDTGHFALEEYATQIAAWMDEFMVRHNIR